MQLALSSLKARYDKELDGIQFDANVRMSDVINDLPFKLTKAQLRVLEDIDKDMESKKPMNRLLQGDVGSGKTIVSVIAAYKAAKKWISGSYNGLQLQFWQSNICMNLLMY